MRAAILLSVLGLSAVIAAACGDSEGDAPDGPGGQASGGPGASQAGATAAGKGGEATPAGGGSGEPGGSTSGGKPAGGAASGGAPGGGAQAGGAAAAGEAGAASLVDCDPRKITCKRAAPQCGTFQVPSVEGSCYGDCVAIERCACDSADACPNPNEFTCWNNAKHCGPFVQ